MTSHAATSDHAVQRLMDEESRQKQADEALLRSTPSAQLLQVPIWSNSLAAGQGGARLEGTLVIPKDCSVRLMRRVFARAAQVSPLTHTLNDMPSCYEPASLGCNAAHRCLADPSGWAGVACSSYEFACVISSLKPG